MVTSGLRDHLSVAATDQVLVWAECDAAGQATGVLMVANAALIERALLALAAFEDTDSKPEVINLELVGRIG
jgi:hypothetical protein